jgi:hypothetical protein
MQFDHYCLVILSVRASRFASRYYAQAFADMPHTYLYVCTGTPNKDESRCRRTLHLRLEMQVFVEDWSGNCQNGPELLLG